MNRNRYSKSSNRTNKSWKEILKLITAKFFPYPDDATDDEKNRLANYGFERKSSVIRLAAKAVAYTILITSVITSAILLIHYAIRAFNLHSDFVELEGKLSLINFGTLVAGLFAFIFAYFEWDFGREEVSIDKYYERLDIVNNRLSKAEYPRLSPKQMHAFAELDKLEYVIMKYQYGFISDRLALRAVENFKEICQNCNNGHFWLDVPQIVYESAYLPETRAIVHNICCEIETTPKLTKFNKQYYY